MLGLTSNKGALTNFGWERGRRPDETSALPAEARYLHTGLFLRQYFDGRKCQRPGSPFDPECDGPFQMNEFDHHDPPVPLGLDSRIRLANLSIVAMASQSAAVLRANPGLASSLISLLKFPALPVRNFCTSLFVEVAKFVDEQNDSDGSHSNRTGGRIRELCFNGRTNQILECTVWFGRTARPDVRRDGLAKKQLGCCVL